MAAQRHAESQEWKGRRIAAELWKLLANKLRNDQWSPEQISALFAKHHIGKVSHEAICQSIDRNKKAGGDRYKHLRHRCKPYRKQSSGRERRGRIKNQVMIDERPSIVDERSRVGDWEMDTVIGRPGGKVLVTMVERKSRFTCIRIAKSKEAQEVTMKLIEALYNRGHKVKTMSFDNFKEFALHERIASVLNAETYFAHPYHSWERGLNENTNGLNRQCFPKGMSLDKLSPKDIKRVTNLLNTGPRTRLDYQTPNDIFNS